MLSVVNRHGLFFVLPCNIFINEVVNDMKLKIINKSILLFILICLFFSPVYAGSNSKQATLDDITITSTRDKLLVYFTVKDCFTDNMIQAIHNGVPATFEFIIEIREVRPFAFDELVKEIIFTHSVKYDTVRKVYDVVLTEKTNEIKALTDFDAVKHAMSKVETVEVADMKIFDKDIKYKLNMRAKLDKVELPMYLHYILFFVSLWDFKTDWYSFDIPK